MTLEDLCSKLNDRPFLSFDGKLIECNDKVIGEYGSREVHDITIDWKNQKVYVFLKATNKEIAEAYIDGFFKD